MADDQLGAVFLIGGDPRGAELFGTPHVLRTLLPKVVRDYALDAMAHAGRDTAVRKATRGGWRTPTGSPTQTPPFSAPAP